MRRSALEGSPHSRLAPLEGLVAAVTCHLQAVEPSLGIPKRECYPAVLEALQRLVAHRVVVQTAAVLDTCVDSLCHQHATSLCVMPDQLSGLQLHQDDLERQLDQCCAAGAGLPWLPHQKKDRRLGTLDC